MNLRQPPCRSLPLPPCPPPASAAWVSAAAARSVRTGLAAILGAQLIWGLMPLYLMLVRSVAALEFVGLRIAFSLPFCLLFVHLSRQFGDLAVALRNPKVLQRLVLSSLLVGTNWLLYVHSINTGQVYAASLGYYLAPLLQVAMGTALLGERLSRRQWSAVTCAALGVLLLLAWGERATLGLGLAIACSWSLYGLVRRMTPVGALPGLTVETLILLPAALLIVLWHAQGPAGSALSQPGFIALFVALSGPVTAIPLFLFAVANRRLEFSTIGMLQFASPTVVFVIALVLGKPPEPAALASFALIWTAIALFVWDLFARRSAGNAPAERLAGVKRHD